ncbi:MAG TPA: non-canonical purine NTP pyrophosphatase [Candidatus Binataceae bacterium]|nr:non-canonical purine NTP pyrophosphatase [Candidatus Binataceae bacterium]
MAARLLIATTNSAKLAEYKWLLRSWPLELLSLREVGIDLEAKETGATFSANALLKARYYFGLARIATLADDGGLEVDALGGAPGVASHRWLGAQADDRALAEAVVARVNALDGVPRTARLRCALALRYECNGEAVEAVTEAAMEGLIASRVHPALRPGFPYRAVLYLPQHACYVSELSEEEEARLSQRRTAIELAASHLTAIATAQL